MQQPNDFMRERGKSKGRSQSGKQKLSHRTPLQILVITERAQAFVAKKSIQMAEEPESQ